MIRRGVRLLLVTDDDRRVHGLITATDILGEKPVTLRMTDGISRQDLKVRDLMVTVDHLEVLNYQDVARAQVGHIVETLNKAGRQHALVCEREPGDIDAVRGIFSLSQIARQLGVTIPPTEIARTFAEIEAALAH
jgi:signal-transduction protein with cAMP-binding, CBS, and nucleotidyltransferase domain